MIKNVRFNTFIILLILNLNISASAFDEATYTNGMFSNSFFSINLGSGWTQNANFLSGDIVTASYDRNNWDFVSINANYSKSTDPLLDPLYAHSVQELMQNRRKTLEYNAGAYNSFSEDSFTTNGGYKVHVLRYTQNAAPSPQHYHFFIDATSSQYSGGQANWFAIDVDFTSTTFPSVMTGISFEEAKAIIQSIDIDNGSSPHQLNGLDHTPQGNSSGSSNSGSANNSNTGSSSNINIGSSNSSANQMLLPTIQSGVLKNNQFSMEVGERWAIEYSILSGLDIYINDIEQKELDTTKLVNKEANKTILLYPVYIETTYREYWSKDEYYDGDGNPSIYAHYLANKDSGYPESLNNPTSAESEVFNESGLSTEVKESYFDQAKTEIKNSLYEGVTEFTEEEFLSNNQYLTWSLSTEKDNEKASTFLIDLSEKNLFFVISIFNEEYAESKKIVETFDFFSSEIDFVANDKQENVFQSSGNVMSKWVESGWMGVFFEASNGWIFHPDLGWLYAEDSSADKTWLYADKKGWLWTSKETYPYLYSHDSTNWIYVVKEDDEPTQAYDYNPGKWSLWQELTLWVIINPNPDQSASKTSENQAIEKVLDSEKSDSSKIREIAEIIKSKL